MKADVGLPYEFGVLKICERMHWSIEQYRKTPIRYLDLLSIKLGIEDLFERQNKPNGQQPQNNYRRPK